MENKIQLNVDLLDAVEIQDLERISECLTLGADTNFRDVLDGATSLHRAVGGGNICVVRMLLDHGAEISRRDNNVQASPLSIAAIAGHLGVVQVLIERGARLDKDEYDVIDEVRDAGLSEIEALLEKSVAPKDIDSQ